MNIFKKIYNRFYMYKHNKIEVTDKLYIYIWGNNSSVKIGKNFSLGLNLNISLGNSFAKNSKIDNVHCKIGENCGFQDVHIYSANSNNNITIGDNCMISMDVNLFNTDAHPIYDKTTGKIINYVNDMKIGNNCWLGEGCSILKGVTVPNGTIVGWRSVVSKSIDKENCAVAGVPAKIVRENITWDKFATREYIDNKIEF